MLILQAGHEGGGVSRRVRWVKLSRKLHCTVRDCEHQWKILQTARKRAAKAMAILGVPTVLLVENSSSSNSRSSGDSSGSSSGTSSGTNENVTSAVEVVGSVRDSTTYNAGISAVTTIAVDPSINARSESSSQVEAQGPASTYVPSDAVSPKLVPAKRK